MSADAEDQGEHLAIDIDSGDWSSKYRYRI
jgi:hypothetical protein